jgi:GTP pyrophosphokinase
VPDEPAIGYLTSKGVIVHRLDCEKVHRWQTERPHCLVRVAWGTLTDKLYPVDIHIRANDRFGLLRDVSSILTHAKINIIAAHTLTDHEAVANMILRLEVKSAGQLSQSLKNIEDLTNVLEVLRLSAESHVLKQLLNANPVNK